MVMNITRDAEIYRQEGGMRGMVMNTTRDVEIYRQEGEMRGVW